MIGPFPPVHPGEVLKQEFLEPYDLTVYALAASTGIPRSRLERLSRGQTSVSADTALRLSRAFGTSADFWMNLQSHYDLALAAPRLASDLERIARIPEAAA